jgi:hypothetical protein
MSNQVLRCCRLVAIGTCRSPQQSAVFSNVRVVSQRRRRRRAQLSTNRHLQFSTDTTQQNIANKSSTPTNDSSNNNNDNNINKSTSLSSQPTSLELKTGDGAEFVVSAHNADALLEISKDPLSEQRRYIVANSEDARKLSCRLSNDVFFVG